MRSVIDFTLPSGDVLSGVLYEPDEKTDKVIIYCHGFTGTSGESPDLTVKANDGGFAVFNFDFFAHGKNVGKSVDLTLSRERDELKAAMDMLSERFSKIGLVGHSLGGVPIVMLANDADAVVLWSPALLVKDVFMNSFENGGMVDDITDVPGRIERDGFVRLTKKWKLPDSTGEQFAVGREFWKEVAEFEPSKFLRDIRVPVRLIQAGMDSSVPTELSEKAFGYIGSKKDFVTIDGANHIFKGKRKELVKLTVDWFKENL